MKKPFGLLLIVAVVVDALDTNSFLTDHSYNDEIIKVPCIISMVKKYIDGGDYQQGGLILTSVSNELNVIGQRVLEALNEDPEHKGTMLVRNIHSEQNTESEKFPVSSKAKTYIFFVENAIDVSITVSQFKLHPSWNPTAPFVVLFMEQMTDFRLTVQTKSVMQDLFEHSVVDVFVISARDKTTVIQCQTWYPYEGKNCGENVISVRTVNECEFFGDDNKSSDVEDEDSDDEEENDDDDDELFLLQYDFSNLGPKLPFDMHGCPLRVQASALEPFVIARDNSIEGFEIVMTKVISEQMNLMPIFKVQDPNVANKMISENNITGLYADLVNNKVDVMIGGMFDNKVSSKILSTSIGYVDDDLTWCVATAKNAPTWMNVFAIFDIQTWIIAVVLVWLTGVMLHFMLIYENKSSENFIWCTLVAMAVSINVPAPYQPKSRYIRIFLASFFLYSMHFSAAYQSFLVSVITRPRFEPQIKSQERAMELGYRFTGGENIKVYLNRNDSISNYIKKNFASCKHLDDCLAELRSNDLLIVASSRQHAENNLAVSDDEIFCFPKTNNIHSYSVKMLVRKDYHLLSKINDLIARVLESGLFGKWYSEAKARKISVKSLQIAASQNTAKALQLKHLAGAYGLLLFGLASSSMSFVGEFLIYFLSRYKNYQWARFLDDTFCSNYRPLRPI